MKVVESEIKTVEQTGGLPTKEFGIKVSAKSFRVLSKGIYNDEIRPPIRELATNAWDSHVAAKNLNTPFEVHLPSLTEPWFHVQDFGVGMSEEEIDTVYTNYFESTKVESNDYVGCLGLGSKSPFCYTDTFNVESIQGGIKCVYICFTENDKPSISLVNKEETDEHSGMKISFSVKLRDIQTFISVAQEIYSYFIHKPKILNNNSFKFKDRDYLVNRDEYRFGGKNDTRVLVVMGNIAYPVTLSQIGQPNDCRFLFDSGLEFNMPIGSLEVATNRESLHFDERTIKNVKTRLKDISVDVKQKVQDEINKFTKFYEALNHIENYDVYNYGWSFKSAVLDKLVFKNKSLSYNYFRVGSMDTGKKKYPDLQEYQYKIRKFYKRGQTIKNVYDSSIEITKNLILVENDLEKGGLVRIRHYIHSNPKKYVYVIKDENDSNICNKMFLRILKYFDFPKSRVIKTSTMEMPPRKPRAKSVSTSKSVSLLQRKRQTTYWSYREHAKDWWTANDIKDVSVGDYVYVLTKNNKILSKELTSRTEALEAGYGCETEPKNFLDDSYKLYCDLSNNKNLEIVGISAYNSSFVFKNKNWTNFYSLLNKLKLEFVNKHKEKYMDLKTKICSLTDFNVDLARKISDLFPDNEELHNCIREYGEHKSTENLEFIRKFEQCMSGIKTDVKFDLSEVKSKNYVLDEIWKKYPMLSPDKTEEDTLNYIKLVNK